MALAAILGLGWLARAWPYAVVAMLAPLLAAYLLIYARLLGRLGWLIVQKQSVEFDDDDTSAEASQDADE